jgi:pimeloyl-ACP methyl ester carboxylesterase
MADLTMWGRKVAARLAGELTAGWPPAHPQPKGTWMSMNWLEGMDRQMVVVDGGPHAIAWTHADQVNRALLDFLAER